LQKKLAEVAKLEDETIEMRGQLQMSELHIKQLQNSSETPSEGAMKQIEELLAARSELQNKLQLTEDAMRNCQMDRDSTIQQYTLFIDQLQQQSRQLQTQVESLMDERDQLASRARELESVVAQLKAKDVASTEMTVQNLEEKAELAEKIERLKSELMAVSKNLEVQSADNSQLSRLIIEKEQRIVELEMTVERATDTAVDKEKLLEIMQGDKTALSRAMAQNKELKNQLAELQNTFVKMSTDNMEMLTRLQSEQHVAKELASRLGQQEDELKEMRELLMHKEHELGDLHKRDAERACEHRHELSSEEMEQRMRHFSEQVPLIESLQRELSSAQDAINALTVQNSNLRSVLEQNASGGGATDGTSGSVAQVEALSTSVRQLEMERDQVLGQLRESQALCQALRDKLQNVQQDLASQVPASLNGDIVTKVQFEALQHAMRQLEEKYTRVMRDKADLTDKAERLEHIILQLQGETDTIGEYVTLYQQQRSAMRRRAEEREGYIYQLARERIDLQTKLGELQALVVQLLGERNMLHAYHTAAANTASTPAATSRTTLPSPPKRRRRTKDGHEPSSSDDWPDYEGSGSDSETGSDTEVVIATTAANESTSPSADYSGLVVHPSHSSIVEPTSHWEHKHNGSAVAFPSSLPSIPLSPAASQTAQKIMSLLGEIGTSNLVERTSLDNSHFLHCAHCSGRLIVL
jgi:myosin heavy subunit